MKLFSSMTLFMNGFIILIIVTINLSFALSVVSSEIQLFNQNVELEINHQVKTENYSSIKINSNSEMFTQATTDGWFGNGTKMYPFIIDPLVINSSITTIKIDNVNSYFILRNFFLTGIGVTTKIGIALNNVSNGFIINNTISNFNSTGILVNSSKRVELSKNAIYNNVEGVSIGNSFNIRVTNNTIQDNEKIGINILSSNQNIISNNTLANLNDEIIFAYSGDNTINDNNIQNGG